MILHKDCVAHHDVAEGGNGHWHQSVPGSEEVEQEGVEQARDGEAQDAPRRLEEGGVQAGDNVEEAIADDQAVDSCSLLPEDAGPGPQVDGKGDQADWDVCKKVNSCLCHVHLGRGF